MLMRALQFRKNCFAAIREIVTPEEMEEAVFTDEKQVREENIRQITENWKKLLQKMKNGLQYLGGCISVSEEDGT